MNEPLAYAAHAAAISDTHTFATATICTDCGHQHLCHETGRAYWQCAWCATGAQSDDPGGKA